MSITKRFLEMYEEDQFETEKVKILYEHDYIKDCRCQGIARQIRAKGILSLSSKQNYLYRKYIQPLFKKEIRYCHWCSNILLKDWRGGEITDEYGATYYWCTEECFEQNVEKGGM